MKRRDFINAAASYAASVAWSSSNADGLQVASERSTTMFIQSSGIRFAYRRFGRKTTVPLVFFQHFNGGMDNWDPAVTDGLALSHEVILFDNAGISSSGGSVPVTIEQMAIDASAFIEGLNLPQVNLLGFSIGGMIAQEVAARLPEKVARMVLIGTAPRNGEGPFPLTDDARQIFTAHYQKHEDLWLAALFTSSAASQQAGRRFLDRLNVRDSNRDVPCDARVAPAQLKAMGDWGRPKGERLAYLTDLKQPALVICGDHDRIIKPKNSFLLASCLPNAQLLVLPDANHSPQSQYPEFCVQQITGFLND